jgi:virginiamycin A acetyltransferase
MQTDKNVLNNKYKQFPRTNDNNTCYLKNCITDQSIKVGDYTIYHDFENPLGFEKKNVLYHYPINNETLTIGKFCSIAHGAKFIFNAANHTLKSISTYPFPLFKNDWDLDVKVTDAWDNKGDIIVGNDVWIGFEALILAGVHIGDGAIIASRTIVNKDIPPYTIVGGAPGKEIRKRFSEKEIEFLIQLQWWNWDDEKIKQNLALILNSDFEALRRLA